VVTLLVQKIFKQKFNITSPIQRAAHKLKPKSATTSARSCDTRNATESGNTPRADKEYYPRQSSRIVAHNLLHTYNEGKKFSSDQKPERTATKARTDQRLEGLHHRAGGNENAEVSR
jgi:hypothetical protein